jgi:hypothetical protein
VAALAAARLQEAVRQHAAIEEGVELVLDESLQLRSGAGLGVGDEAGRMPLHQPVQHGLLGAVALVAERAVCGFTLSRQRESGHVAASMRFDASPQSRTVRCKHMPASCS